MDVLGIYLAFSTIICFLVFSCLIGYGVSHKEVGMAGTGIVGVIVMGFLFSFSVNKYHEPKAIEVYQGKTTLEYTIRDGVRVDSVVVYNDNI